MEVGEYVRTELGQIMKIDEGLKEFIDMHMSFTKKDRVEFLGKIKYSKEPKNLIEEGDILRYRLNNLSAIKIGEVRKYKDARSFKEYLGVEGFSLEQIEILKIVTKEQIKSIEYEV